MQPQETGIPMIKPTLLVLALAASALGQSESPRASIAIEADALAYALPGYSGIVNVSLRNRLQFAVGTGRYEVPNFLLKGDKSYDQARWKATATSLQVYRVGYRFRGPMKDGPVAGLILLDQKWRLRSERFAGETRFRPISAGITGGYYFHIGKHFYIYPTGAYTFNRVQSGSTSLGGFNYRVEKSGLIGSVHVGWEWGL
jgi:hypothetical protein